MGICLPGCASQVFLHCFFHFVHLTHFYWAPPQGKPSGAGCQHQHLDSRELSGDGALAQLPPSKMASRWQRSSRRHPCWGDLSLCPQGWPLDWDPGQSAACISRLVAPSSSFKASKSLLILPPFWSFSCSYENCYSFVRPTWVIQDNLISRSTD